jgi:hypothetical protein
VPGQAGALHPKRKLGDAGKCGELAELRHFSRLEGAGDQTTDPRLETATCL